MTRFLVLYAGMTVVAAALAAWAGCPSLFALPQDPFRLWLSLAAAVVGSLAIVWGGQLLEGVRWYRLMATYIKRLLTSPELLGPDLDSHKAFVVAVYSAVGEEALFRGFLQPWLIAVLGRLAVPEGAAAPVGVVATSLIFGALHFPLVRELVPWTAFAILAGLMFGGLAAWSGSLAAPALAHLLINWLNLRRLAELRLEDR